MQCSKILLARCECAALLCREKARCYSSNPILLCFKPSAEADVEDVVLPGRGQPANIACLASSSTMFVYGTESGKVCFYSPEVRMVMVIVRIPLHDTQPAPLLHGESNGRDFRSLHIILRSN